MEALGGIAIMLIRGITWITLGILTFNWIDVHSFGSAIVWLFVWHLATVALSWVLMMIIGGLLSSIE